MHVDAPAAIREYNWQPTTSRLVSGWPNRDSWYVEAALEFRVDDKFRRRYYLSGLSPPAGSAGGPIRYSVARRSMALECLGASPQGSSAANGNSTSYPVKLILYR